jgi:hypothetical protein
MNNNSKAAPALDWAPYGFMCPEFEDEAERECVPGAWSGPAFTSWVEGLTDRLATFAWPRWAAQGWVGAAATNAYALTRADMTIMSNCMAQMHQDARQKGAKANSWWFNWEDDLGGKCWKIRFETGFPGCTVDAEQFRLMIGERAMDKYYGGLVFMLKRRLQRPRAFQMSWILGHKYPIAPMASLTAWSPSANSGHAFQGLMGCLGAYLEFPSLAPYRDDLAMLAADIGDRRVLAGIHYPSDNAMSWWAAFQCVKHVAKDDAQRQVMRDFLRDAIQGSSLLAPMKKSAAHKPLMDEVTAALNEN